MILDGEVKKQIRTLGDYVELCREMSASEIETAVASAFFVCKPQSALHTPEGPQATLRVDVRLITAAKEGRFAEGCPAWPLRRREDSIYSFLSVGRTQNCDVWIPDESVSKLHALVRERSGAFHIVDANSRNPTLVEREAIARRGEGEPRALTSGAAVTFGNVETVFFSAADFRRVVQEVAGFELP